MNDHNQKLFICYGIQQVIEEKEKRISEIIQTIKFVCDDISHSGFGRPRSVCDHPNCVVESILRT